jgi:hypothetical protein
MGRMQAPHERLTRSQFKRRQAQARRREEARWAARSGPVSKRTDVKMREEFDQRRRELGLYN